MTLLKTALKNMKKNAALSLMILMQITTLFLTTSVMVSSLYLRMRAYYPFEDYYNRKGFCFFMGIRDRLFDRNGNIITSSETIMQETNAENVVAAHNLRAYLYPESKDTYFKEGFNEIGKEYPNLELLGEESLTLYGMSYDDEILNHYTPELSEGRWFDLNAEEIEAVIASNYAGLLVGDEVYMWLEEKYDVVNVKIKIVGQLKDGTRIFGAPSSLERPDYRNIISVYNDDEVNPLILFSHSVLKKQCPDVIQPVGYTVMVKYADTADTDVITKDIKTISANSSIMGLTSMGDIKSRSMRFINEQVYMLLPVIIVLTVLTLVSSVNASALAARHRLRDYAKFYIVGLTWRKCIMVNLLQSIIINEGAAVLTIIGVYFIRNTKLAQEIMVFGNFWTVAAVAALAMLNILFSMIMPLIMLSRTSPKELLQTK